MSKEKNSTAKDNAAKDKEKRKVCDDSDLNDSQSCFLEVNSKEELKSYLMLLRDKLSDRSAAPVFVLSSLNNILTLPAVYDFLTDETKEIARDIWLRLKRTGFHILPPPLLFKPDEVQSLT